MKCRSNLFFGNNKAEIEKEKFQYLKAVKLKIPRGRKSELVVSCQVVINPFCGLSVIFCGFISRLIGRETINIPEIFSGVHGFTGKTVNVLKDQQWRELRMRMRRTCPAVYLYDNVHKFGHGEMRNKKLKIEKNDITQEWQFYTP